MTTMDRRRFLSLAAAGAAGAALALGLLPGIGHAATAGADLRGLGVLYLHGKASWPGAMNGGILKELEDEGALTAAPEMPWSFNRRYAATYEQALGEIDAAIAGLRRDGAQRIVIIGHSLGANAAIGYAARHPGLAGVVAIAPAHLPETDPMRDFVSGAVARAKELVAAGQGNVRESFPDMAQGIPLTTHATATVYLSMFDPDGPAVIPKNAALMGAAAHPVPLLWVVGKLDPIDRRGPEYAFSAAATNPKSKYIEVFAGHLTTPSAARRDIVSWINAL